MTVLDTHAWLWWISGDARLSPAARTEIEHAEELIVATISIWELATLERRGRLRLLPNLGTWVRRSLGGRGVAELPLTPEIAIEAGRLPDGFGGDPADRIIYASSLITRSRLVTGDRRIRVYDSERTIW